MFDVRTVVEFGKGSKQSDASDGSPADKFDEAVGGVGIGSDEHGAASVLAVVKSEKQ